MLYSLFTNFNKTSQNKIADFCLSWALKFEEFNSDKQELESLNKQFDMFLRSLDEDQKNVVTRIVRLYYNLEQGLSNPIATKKNIENVFYIYEQKLKEFEKLQTSLFN